MSIDAERYTGLIGLADAFARASSTRMVRSALAEYAPAILGCAAAVLFQRRTQGGADQNFFDPVTKGRAQRTARSFSAVWPIHRAGLVHRSSSPPHYRALWDALDAFDAGTLVHQPIGPNAQLVIAFAEADRELTDLDWMVLRSLAEQAAAAQERIDALAQVRELTLADAATGIGNRRLVEIALEHRFGDAVRGAPLSVVSLRPAGARDFAGDAAAPALRRVGELLRSLHRASDVSAHLGDGIFVVVLASSTEAGAQAFLRRVTTGIDDVPFTYGVAEHDLTFETPSELLATVLSRVDATPLIGRYGAATIDSSRTSTQAH